MSEQKESKTFTDLFLQRLPQTATTTYHWDKALPGFGIRVGKTRKTFTVIRGTVRERITVGQYPIISLQEARKKAKLLLATKGRQNPTTGLQDALAAFLKLHCEPLKNYKQMEWNLRSHLKKDISLHRIDRAFVQEILDEIRHTPGEANHFFQYFRTFMFWCVKRGYLEHYPLTGMTMPHKIIARDRTLTNEEIIKLWHVLEDDTFSRTVKLLILTGCRKSEIQNLVVTGDTATLPATHSKNGREHTFPLPAMAIPLFDYALNFNGWSKAKARLDKKLTTPPWTLHDLRRTYATIHAQLGTPIHITERLLNHISGSFGGIVSTYQKYTHQPEMRKAVDAYEQFIQSLIARA